jgi:lipid A 3-O-deacylase
MDIRSYARLARLLLWLVGLIASCAGQTPAEPRDAEPQLSPAVEALRVRPGIWEDEIGNGFHRGTTQIGSGLAAGFGTHALGSKDGHDLALTSLRFGRMLSGPGAGNQWYRGNLELLGELWGGIQIHPRHRFLVGFTPLLRHNFATGGRWVPFVEGGVGVAYTNIAGRDLSNGFQFNLQAGAGTHFFLREDTALTLEYRFFHLSNAGLNVPNTGLNTELVFAGLSRFY